MEFEERSSRAGKWEEAKRVPGDVNEAEVTLHPFGTYHFRVIAVNDVGRSHPSEVSEAHITPPAGENWKSGSVGVYARVTACVCATFTAMHN